MACCGRQAGTDTPPRISFDDQIESAVSYAPKALRAFAPDLLMMFRSRRIDIPCSKINIALRRCRDREENLPIVLRSGKRSSSPADHQCGKASCDPRSHCRITFALSKYMYVLPR